MAQEILIVDDDRRLAAACARHLEEAGYRCRQAHEGRQAVIEVRNAAPDLILLDLLLPKQDGRAVLAELHKAPTTANIPVIVMTGVFKDKRTAKECEDAGARGFLEKPFEFAALLTEVHAVLGQPTPSGPESNAMRVPLSDVPVSEYLWRTMRGGFSGAVHFQRGKMHKILLLENGSPRAIRSNAFRETLGERLLQAGRITPRQHEESLRRVKREKRLQGEVLVEMGALTAPAIERCLAEQIEEKLLETFRWTEGESWLQPGVRAVSYASQLENWTPEDVVICGSLQMPVDRVTMILGLFSAQRLAVMSKALPDRAARLTPITAALRAAGEARALAPLIAEHAGALYGLWLTGKLQFAAAASDPARRAAAAPPAAAPPAAAGGESLSAVLAQWKNQNYYEILGVAENATREDIQAAYLQLARRYHPDRFNRETEDLRISATALFTLLGSARDTLSDPSARTEYARKLRGDPGDGDREQLQRIMGAEKLCQNGEALLRKHNVPAALAAFAEAIRLNPNEGEFHALFGWAHFLAHRGGEDAEAEKLALESLQRAIELAPESPKGYYYLAQLHKARERPDMARKLFAKVLQLDPEHVEAQREKRLLLMRKDKDPKSSSGGIFGFGRKKS